MQNAAPVSTGAALEGIPPPVKAATTTYKDEVEVEDGFNKLPRDLKLACDIKNILTDTDYNLRTTSHQVYGFLTDITKSYWENCRKILGEMKCYHYFTCPSNMQYHNLCETAAPPPGLLSLLSMGLNFCIESPRPNKRIGHSIQRLRRSIRLHFQFLEEERKNANDDNQSASSNPNKDVTYILSLYLPSTWEPPEKNEKAGFAIGELNMRLTNLQQALLKPRRYNLSPSQRNVIKELQNRSNLVLNPIQTRTLVRALENAHGTSEMCYKHTF
jgi:hypothetical protein